MVIIEDKIVGNNIEVKFRVDHLFGLFSTHYHVISRLHNLRYDDKINYINFYHLNNNKKISDVLCAKITNWILLNKKYKRFLLKIINHFITIKG